MEVEKKKKNQKKVKKLNITSEGAGVIDTVVGRAVDGFVEYELPWMGRKAVEKLTPLIQYSVGSAMDQLSTKVRPKKRYKTDRPELDGGSNPVSYGRVGGKVDIHNAILKVAPKKGFVLPGH